MSNQIFSYTNHNRMLEPNIFVSGSNDILVDSKGKSYVDCNSGLWNVNYGYNNPSYRGVDDVGVHFYPNHFWSSTRETEVAATRICDHFGYHKVFFGHGGSDAINTAVYISRWKNKKRDVLAYSKGYHGATLQAKSCDSYGDLINSIGEDTSAVLIEPLMVTHGISEFDTSVLSEIFALRDRYSFNVIFDETVTALGRGDYHRLWSADMLIASKGLTNGVFPLSAVMVNAELADHIANTNEVFSHGFTTSGHPIGCNALCRTLDIRVNHGDRTKEFSKLFSRYGLDFTAYNMIFSLHVSDGAKLKRLLHQEGYLIRQHVNDLLFLPMFTADVSNYVRFAEIVATFQGCDR